MYSDLENFARKKGLKYDKYLLTNKLKMIDSQNPAVLQAGHRQNCTF
jgi:hypothetical protein